MTPPRVVTGGPAASGALADRELARVAIANADGIASVDGSLWVKTDDGRVVKVDPLRNRIVGEIRLDTSSDRSHYCQGIGADGTSVWACAATDHGIDVVQLNPQTLRPVRRLALNKIFDQVRMPLVGGRVWVLTDDGKSLVAIDPASGRLSRYRLPTSCLQLEGRGQVLLATCRGAGRVLRINPASGKVAASADIGSPGIAAVTASTVWVDSSDGVLELDADSLQRRVVYSGVHAGPDGDLAVDAGHRLWVRQKAGFLILIDPASSSVVEALSSPVPLSGGSLLVTADEVWTTAYDDGLLIKVRLYPASGAAATP
ncbi:MAG: hypothetical protein QOJ92_1705 [Frankiales bacterium]|nr:hypothetical protein [Frankiales bacterium]